MKKGKIIALALALGAMLCWNECPAQRYKGVRDMQGGETVELGRLRFAHPMTVTTAGEIKEVKKRIAKGTEPQASAYRELIAAADRALAFVPDPPDTMLVMGGYEAGSNLSAVRAQMWRNCSAAYTCALAYAYCGDSRYADQAVNILNAWARKGTVFTGKDRGLQLGSFFLPMLYAADLSLGYRGWTAADRERFRTWWTGNCLPYTDEVMTERYNNWKDAGLLGTMCAAVVFEDAALLERGLNELSSYFRARNDRNGKPLPADWKIRKDERGVYLPHEVVRNDGRSGLTYTAYATTTMVQCMEIARYAGFNFWTARTPQGASVQDVIEQYYRWMIEGDPFPWNPAPTRYDPGTRYNIFEIANNHCRLQPQIVRWLETVRPVPGAQGDEYATLNKGGLRY